MDIKQTSNVNFAGRLVRVAPKKFYDSAIFSKLSVREGKISLEIDPTRLDFVRLIDNVVLDCPVKKINSIAAKLSKAKTTSGGVVDLTGKNWNQRTTEFFKKKPSK